MDSKALSYADEPRLELLRPAVVTFAGRGGLCAGLLGNGVRRLLASCALVRPPRVFIPDSL